MKLKDLKRGMKCVLRNGIEFLVDEVAGSTIHYIGNSVGRNGSERSAVRLAGVADDLTSPSGREYDIVEVFEPHITEGYVSIYKYAKELTVKEISELLGYDVKVVK